MPSYNTDKIMLKEAVDSILRQTYKRLELIVIDDGSKEPVIDVLDIKDDRLKIIRNDENKGIVYSLNRGLEYATGEYIARMDADDISDETRIEIEVDYLENNKDVDVVSTYARTFGIRNTLYKSETSPEGIRAELLWKNPIIHPTVLMRASLIRNDFIKYSMENNSEDFDLWSRIVYQYNKKIAVIPKPLLQYRIHETQITQTKTHELKIGEKSIISENMRALGVKLDQMEYNLYTKARNEEITRWNDLRDLYFVFSKLLKQLQYQEMRQVLKKRYAKELLKNLIKVTVHSFNLEDK